MNKYRIFGSMGYAGTDWEDEVEADSYDDALAQAQDYALERVSYGAEPMENDYDE